MTPILIALKIPQSFFMREFFFAIAFESENKQKIASVARDETKRRSVGLWEHVMTITKFRLNILLRTVQVIDLLFYHYVTDPE